MFEPAPIAFATYQLIQLCFPALALAVGLVTRRQFQIVTPLWMAGALMVGGSLGLLTTSWNAQIVERFLAQDPPIAISLGEAVSLLSMGFAFLNSVAFLMLFSLLVGELIAMTRDRLDWGGGRLVGFLPALVTWRTPIGVVAVVLVAIASLGPAITASLLAD